MSDLSKTVPSKDLDEPLKASRTHLKKKKKKKSFNGTLSGCGEVSWTGIGVRRSRRKGCNSLHVLPGLPGCRQWLTAGQMTSTTDHREKWVSTVNIFSLTQSGGKNKHLKSTAVTNQTLSGWSLKYFEVFQRWINQWERPDALCWQVGIYNRRWRRL